MVFFPSVRNKEFWPEYLPVFKGDLEIYLNFYQNTFFAIYPLRHPAGYPNIFL